MKQCKVRKGKITPPLHRLPSPKKQINKKKGKIWVRANDGTNETNRIESTRNQKQKRRDLPILAILQLYMLGTLTQNDLSTSLALSHARTHAQRPSQAYFHPFFLDYIIQKGIPPRHKKSHRARNSRPANQPVRERERFSFCLGHITEYDFISPQHASYQHTVLDAEAADDENDENDDGYPTNYIAPHPTRSSFFIHPFNYKVCDKLVTVSQSISQSAKPSCSFPRDSERNRETEEESQRDRREKEGVTLSQPAVQLKRYAKIIAPLPFCCTTTS